MLVVGTATALLTLFGFLRTQDNATKQSQEEDALYASAHMQAFIGEPQLGATAGFGQQAARYMIDLKLRRSTP
jgi:hypothetical protein